VQGVRLFICNPKQGEPLAKLLVILATGEKKLVTSQKEILRIGRRSDNEILLDDPSVSRRHAEIFQQDGTFYIIDTGSTNGTLLNGLRIIGPVELAPADSIEIGTAEIVFEPEAEPDLHEEQGAAQPALKVSMAPAAKDAQTMVPLFYLQAVAEVAVQLTQEKPLEALLSDILQLCIEWTSAERVAILLLDAQGDLQPRFCLSKQDALSSFAVSRSIARQAMMAQEAVLIRDVASNATLQLSDSVLKLRIRSAVCAPLSHGERTVGVLYADTTRAGELFNDAALLFYSSLAGLVAEKLEKALLIDIAQQKRQLDAELDIAAEIQARFFPLEIPNIKGYDLAACNFSSREVGGDYFDIFPISDGFAIAIADVTGKGIGAALLMANLQAALRVRAAEISAPDLLLQRVNADLSRRVGDDHFITFFYLALEPSSGRVLYANAGHNRPLLYRDSGELVALQVSGIPLGIFADSSYEPFEVDLMDGDVLLLYSDGITECVNPQGEQFGEDRLQRLLSSSAKDSAETIKENVFSTLERFRQGREDLDDMTLVVIKRLKQKLLQV